MTPTVTPISPDTLPAGYMAILIDGAPGLRRYVVDRNGTLPVKIPEVSINQEAVFMDRAGNLIIVSHKFGIPDGFRPIPSNYVKFEAHNGIR